MWTIIILGTLGAFILGYLVYRDDGPWGLGIFFGAIFGIVIALAVMLFIPLDREIHSNTQQLETLTDNLGGGEGQFFLGCGTIKSKMVYVYYSKTRTDDQGKEYYSMDMIDYDDTEVTYIDSTEPPCLETIWYEKSDAFIYNFTYNIHSTHYIFHVPEGTINNNYTLDAQ